MEPAPGDDDRGAGDLDPLDPLRAAVGAGVEDRGRPSSSPWRISISSPNSTRPCRQRWTASGPAAEPVAGSSATPSAGANIRVFQRGPAPEKQLAPIAPISVSAAMSGRSAATAASLSSST